MRPNKDTEEFMGDLRDACLVAFVVCVSWVLAAGFAGLFR
jgi:hypothetical protein